MVSVLINGKWETRMFDDVYKIIMKTTEEYFNPFFVELQDKYDEIIQSNDSRKLMQLMAPIWRLATHITQHMVTTHNTQHRQVYTGLTNSA